MEELDKHNESTSDNKNPWMGLLSYTDPRDSEIKGLQPYHFYGRDKETEDIVQLITNNIFTTLYGKSGVGKTSVLNAGAFPMLRELNYIPVRIRLSKDAIGISFQQCIINKIEQAIKQAGKKYDTFDEIPLVEDETLPDFLWSYFARTRFSYARSENLSQVVFPVIVLDQFEEVLRDRQREAEILLRQIAFMTDESHSLSDRTLNNGYSYRYDFNYRFVVSIREDHLFRLEDCIDNNYLLDLKHCRYRLRPMKPEQARQVIRIGIDEGCIKEEQASRIEEIIIDLLTKGSSSKEIDPLLLSLICAKTYSIKKGRYIEPGDLTYWGKGNDLLGKYYEEATIGLNSYQKRSLQSLVADDGSGSRKRKNKKQVENQLGSKEFRKLTEGDNKLLVIDDTSGTVELIHDMLCPIIQQSKEELIKKQNNVILSLLLGIIACLGIYSFHTCFIHHIVEDKTSNLSVLYFALSSFFVLAPIICTTTINRLKTSKILASILTAIITIPILVYRNEKDLDPSALTIAYCLCAFCLILIFLAFRKQEYKEVVKPFLTIRDSLPLQLYYFVMFAYLFVESVFGSYLNTISRSQCIPASSIWGLIILPLLSLHITNRLLNRETKYGSVPEWCMLIVTIVLAFNVNSGRSIPLLILISLLFAFIVCLWFHYKGHQYRQRAIATIINSLVIVIVFVCNLGFNVFCIKYSSVKQIYPYSWGTVFVQNDNKLIGAVDAWTGDTVVPAVLQFHPTIKNIKNRPYQYYHICKDNESYYNQALLNSEVENDTMYLQTSFLQTSLFERDIKYSHLPDTTKVFDKLTLKVFEELRNAILLNSTLGKPFNTKDMPNLNELIERQNIRYSNCYNDIENKNRKNKKGEFLLTENDMSRFVVNLTRNLYLLQLHEVLSDSLNSIDGQTKQNTVALYRPLLMTDYVDLYNLDTSSIDLKTNLNFITNSICFHDNFSIHTRHRELKSNDLIDWFKLYKAVFYLDIAVHEKDFSIQLNQYVDLLSQLSNSLQNANTDLDKNNLAADFSKIQATLDQVADVSTNMKNDIDKKNPFNNYFKNTIKTAFNLLANYSESEATAPFAEKCIELCEYLYISGRGRKYDSIENFKNRLDTIIKEKELHYQYQLNSSSKDKKGERGEESLYYVVNASDSILNTLNNEISKIQLLSKINSLQINLIKQTNNMPDISGTKNKQLNTKP